MCLHVQYTQHVSEHPCTVLTQALIPLLFEHVMKFWSRPSRFQKSDPARWFDRKYPPSVAPKHCKYLTSRTGSRVSSHSSEECWPHFLSVPSSVCVNTPIYCLFIHLGHTLHVAEALSVCFLSFLRVRVYRNLRSLFLSVNVVTAGLNRMQVRCNISLYERYTGWPECPWPCFPHSCAVWTKGGITPAQVCRFWQMALQWTWHLMASCSRAEFMSSHKSVSILHASLSRSLICSGC